MPEAIKVQGLRDLRKAIKDLDQPSQTREFREGLKDAASIVARDAAHRASRFSRRGAATIRATAGGNVAYVVEGKKALPWMGWADFGGRTPRPGQPRTVGPWARTGKGPRGGRFVYPALEAKERQVADALGDALDDAFRKAGF